MTIPYVYDAGALIALDGGERPMWARHRIALEEGRRIHVPTVVVAQVWRDARRQVQLAKVLDGCEIWPVDLKIAKTAGQLCAASRTADVVDAMVVVVTATIGAIVWTSDAGDLHVLASAYGTRPALSIRAV